MNQKQNYASKRDGKLHIPLEEPQRSNRLSLKAIVALILVSALAGSLHCCGDLRVDTPVE